MKTIWVTKDAYETLRILKMGNESYSGVILRLTKEQRGAVTGLSGGPKGSDKT